VVTADRLTDFEAEAVSPLPEGRLSELAGASRAMNRLVESRRLGDGLVDKEFARRLAAEPRAALPHRAEVTVLATGRIDFARHTRGLADDATVALLRRHLTLVAGRIQAHGGIVLSVAGDGLIALFGAPGGPPEHAARAVAAAGEVRRFAEQEHAQREAMATAPLGISIGIASGEVIVGDLGPAGRTTFTVLGPAVPTARRLECLAREFGATGEPVTALASEATAGAAGISGSATSLGRHPVADDGAEVEVFRL
jgi:class 3 adenylate cyclase